MLLKMRRIFLSNSSWRSMASELAQTAPNSALWTMMSPLRVWSDVQKVQQSFGRACPPSLPHRITFLAVTLQVNECPFGFAASAHGLHTRLTADPVAWLRGCRLRDR